MTANTRHAALIKQLKQKVAVLQKKEERNRSKFRAALKKMHSLADKIELQVLKAIESRARMIANAAAKAGKKPAAKHKKTVRKAKR